MKSANFGEFCEMQKIGLLTICVQDFRAFYKAERRLKVKDIFFEITKPRKYAPNDSSALLQKGIGMIA